MISASVGRPAADTAAGASDILASCFTRCDFSVTLSVLRKGGPMRSNRGVVIGVLTAVVLMIVFTTYDVQSLINASEPGLVTLPWAGGSGGGGGSGGSGGPAGGHSTSPSEAGPAGEVAVGANGALLQAFTVEDVFQRKIK